MLQYLENIEPAGTQRELRREMMELNTPTSGLAPLQTTDISRDGGVLPESCQPVGN